MSDDEKPESFLIENSEYPEPDGKEAKKVLADEGEKEADSEDEQSDSVDEAEEQVSTNYQAEDLLGDEAYDLEHGSPLSELRAGEGDALPWHTDVKNPREFFNTEILYRYDILEDDEQKQLKGSYKIDLKGKDGGVWILEVDGELAVSNESGDAKDKNTEVVLKMEQGDFLSMVNGQLNPQLALLSQKMKTQGEMRRIVALQRILTPSPE